jgi:hypothetical protein
VSLSCLTLVTVALLCASLITGVFDEG